MISVPVSILTALFAAVAAAREIQEVPPPGQQCGFEGNDDVYGLGIRLAVYVQVFASSLASAYSQQSARGVSFANDFFVFAMLIALAYLTFPSLQLEVAEAAIIFIFTICCGSVSTAVYTRPHRPAHLDVNTVGFVLKKSVVPIWKHVMGLAGDAYFTWYWWAGLDQLKLSPCSGYAFVFVKVSLLGRLRTAMKFFSVVMILWDLYHFQYMLRHGMPVRGPKIWRRFVAPKKRKQDETEMWWYLKNLSGLFFACGVSALYAVAVELMIRWNNVNGVDQLLGSVGQIIPLLVAGGSLTAVIMDWNDDDNCRGCQERQAREMEEQAKAMVAVAENDEASSDKKGGPSASGEPQVAEKEVGKDVV